MTLLRQDYFCSWPDSRIDLQLKWIPCLCWSCWDVAGSRWPLTKQSRKPAVLAKTVATSKLIQCPVLMLCSANADLSGWYTRMCRECSLHMVSVEQPVCPSYTLPHSHGTQKYCFSVNQKPAVPCIYSIVATLADLFRGKWDLCMGLRVRWISAERKSFCLKVLLRCWISPFKLSEPHMLLARRTNMETTAHFCDGLWWELACR
jgi:hypothetical protein